MDAAQLTAFREQAQLQLEAAFPAEITFDAGAAVIACAGGNFSDSAHELGEGGFFPQYAATFRVRRALLAAAPAVGDKLQWRRPGEATWREELRIERLADHASDPAYVLGCEAITEAAR